MNALDRKIQIAQLASELRNSVPLPGVSMTEYERFEVAAGLALAVSQRESEKSIAAICTALMQIWIHDERTDEFGWAVDFFEISEIMTAFDLAVDSEREATNA